MGWLIAFIWVVGAMYINGRLYNELRKEGTWFLFMYFIFCIVAWPFVAGMLGTGGGESDEES